MTNLTPYLAITGSILSAVIGSFLGFLWQTKKDNKKDKKSILITLMAYRGIGSEEHDWVKALNMVDVVYYDNKKVRTLLHDYFKHLYRPLYDTGAHKKILLDLLHEMVKDIGYKNIKQSDIMDFYFPESLGRLYPTEPDKGVPSNASLDK
jgi:hypothetical protein